MKSAVAVSLVPEAAGGPFMFWGDIASAFRRAASTGFDAVEIFPPSASAIDTDQVKNLRRDHNLEVAAVGTGAGWVTRRLHLCHADSRVREQAVRFIEEIIDAAAALGAPAIIGSMQGRAENGVSREQALEWLRTALRQLAARAEEQGQTILYEPLNRYETNLFNRLSEAVGFLDAAGLGPVRVLADLFHMNIEEDSVCGALRAAGSRVGHVHFSDSNRMAMGFGHTNAEAVTATLREIGYHGFLSSEILPLPDADTAAAKAVETFRKLMELRHA